MKTTGRFIQYEHHGIPVWVRPELKGKHRKFGLCHHCEKFYPVTHKDSHKNCHLANQLYEFCVLHGMVTPVWECPEFQPKT